MVLNAPASIAVVDPKNWMRVLGPFSDRVIVKAPLAAPMSDPNAIKAVEKVDFFTPLLGQSKDIQCRLSVDIR